VFCLAAVLGLATIDPDAQTVLSMLLVALIATTAVYVSLSTLTSPMLVVTTEAVLVCLVVGMELPGNLVFLPYLVLLTFIAGTGGGVVSVSVLALTQFGIIGVLTALSANVAIRQALIEALAPWLVTSILAGLLGAWLRSSGRLPWGAGVADPYEAARRLLSQLRAVSGHLTEGLDLVSLGSQTLARVSAQTPFERGAVFMRTPEGRLSPLTYSDETARRDLEIARVEQLASQTHSATTLVIEEGRSYTLLPLAVGARTIGVVLVQLAFPPAPDRLSALVDDLSDQSLRLDAALVFDEIRSLATAEERRRLAREIHDGVAQEIASVGYMVDDLQATSETPHQRESLRALREELSRITTEIRLSIFDLRSEVVSGAGIGTALSDYLRQVGTTTKMKVHLSLDEAPSRLRPEVEAELLRIAGEAITNARKHAEAENLWVTCTVRPPFARIDVTDDGSGIASRRPDSYGLRIMQERADRIGAKLQISQDSPHSPPVGTSVSVIFGDETLSPDGQHVA
jgi:signal transduction histidine kinase